MRWTAIGAVVMLPFERSVYDQYAVDIVTHSFFRPFDAEDVKAILIVKPGRYAPQLSRRVKFTRAFSALIPAQEVEALASRVTTIVDDLDHVDLRRPPLVFRVKPECGPEPAAGGHLHADLEITVPTGPFSSAAFRFRYLRFSSYRVLGRPERDLHPKHVVTVIAVALPLVVQMIQLPI